MFPFGHNPRAPSYQPCDQSGQLSLQELQRRRQAAEDAHRIRLEGINHRAAQFEAEHARRMAELQREAETLHRRRMELEAESRKLSESAHLLGVQSGDPRSRCSKFDGGVQDMFNTFYSQPLLQSPPVPATRQHFMPSPKVTQKRSSIVDPKPKARFASKDVSEFLTPETLTQVDVFETEQSTSPNAKQPVATKTTPTISSTAPEETVSTAEAQRVDTSPSCRAIVDILSKFEYLKSGFAFPTTLDFLPSPEGVSAPTPKLAFTPNNAPLHQYEHLLTGLLTQLDAVESYGNAEVRKARKDAVKEIEKELGELDRRKVHEWRRQVELAASEVMVAELTLSDVDTTRAALSTGAIAPQVPPFVDPTSVPLPHEDDWELQMDDISESPASSYEPTVPNAFAKPSLPLGSKEPHADVSLQRLAVPSKLMGRFSPAPSSPSGDAKPAQATTAQEPCVETPTVEAGDAVDDEYVRVPPAEKVGVVHPGSEALKNDHIKDGWELNF